MPASAVLFGIGPTVRRAACHAARHRNGGSADEQPSAGHSPETSIVSPLTFTELRPSLKKPCSVIVECAVPLP